MVFAGNDGYQCLNDVHILNVETWSWSRPGSGRKKKKKQAAAAAAAAAAASSGSNGYQPDSPPQNSMALISPSGSLEELPIWYPPTEGLPPLPQPQQVGIQPPPRAGHTATLAGRKMIVFGGGDGKLLSDMYYFNVDTMQWFPMEGGNVPDRCNHTCDAYDLDTTCT
jgi:hypothetical protein